MPDLWTQPRHPQPALAATLSTKNPKGGQVPRKPCAHWTGLGVQQAERHLQLGSGPGSVQSRISATFSQSVSGTSVLITKVPPRDVPLIPTSCGQPKQGAQRPSLSSPEGHPTKEKHVLSEGQRQGINTGQNDISHQLPPSTCGVPSWNQPGAHGQGATAWDLACS